MARGLSARAHSKVLESATELFAERGIDTTSVDAIAAASGVSKATIYKHWADKEALCREVIQFVHHLDDGPPEVDSGDLRADLIAFLRYEPSRKKAAIIKKLMPDLIAYSARNEEFGRAWKTRVMDRARTSLKMLLRRGVDQVAFLAALRCRLGRGVVARADAVPAYFRVECESGLAGGRGSGFVLASARPAREKKKSESTENKVAGVKKY